MASGRILSEKRGPVGLCTIDRPEALNALSPELVLELLRALEAFDRDPSVRVLVLTGGPKVFVAGADIKEMAGYGAHEISQRDPLAVWDRFGQLASPVIAAVNGFALGGGCELAMACDLIVAAEDAVFAQPEILLGVMPGAGGTQRLTRALGKARAMELLLTGKRLQARQALAAGLINAVVPPSLVLEEALRLAGEIAAMPPLAARQIKASVRAALDLELEEGLRQERRRFYSLFDTQDQKEGMAAFVEKRKPAFQGR